MPLNSKDPIYTNISMHIFIWTHYAFENLNGEKQSHLYRVDILEGSSQRITDPSIDLHRQQFGLISNCLFSRLKQFCQHFHNRLESYDLGSKFTERNVHVFYAE